MQFLCNQLRANRANIQEESELERDITAPATRDLAVSVARRILHDM